MLEAEKEEAMLENADIFVTGGAGTLGRAIARRRMIEGWRGKLTVYSTDEHKHAFMRRKFPDVNYVCGDIRNPETLYNAMVGHDVVIHAAAVKVIPISEYNSIDTFEVNVIGSQVVCATAVRANIKHALFISTDKACLEWHSPVLLDSGKTIEIGELVNKKVECNVQSYAVEPFDHKIKSMKVNNWYKNKLNGRKMLSVSYENAPNIGGVDAHVLLTEDHKIMCIKDGYMYWIEASKISESGAKLITSEWKFNWLQEALLCGTVMGDSSLSIEEGAKTRPRLRMAHAIDQVEWLELKSKAFALKKNLNSQKGKNGRQDTVYVNSSTSASLFEYLNYFYKEGRKIIPKELFLRCFNHGMTRPILMSSWYMDDGCTTDGIARIATHGFTSEEVDWLSTVLTEEGFLCYSYMVTVDGKDYYELRFTKEGSDKLYKLIAEYIPPSMRHKIPYPFKEIEYHEKLWNLGETVFYHAKPIIVEVGKNKTGDVYCVDVEETHNFIVNNMILHNCHPANAYGASKMMMEKIVQEYARAGLGPQFHLLRYGNVLESTGSVVEAWHKAVHNGEPIKMTDPAMTRFWLSPSQAVDYVIQAIQLTSDTIFVPKMKALSIQKMADYTVLFSGSRATPSDVQIQRIPLRPGEKMHETLVTEEEIDFVLQSPGYFLVRPTIAMRIEANRTHSMKDFTVPYTSDIAEELTQAELLNMLAEEND